MSTIKDVQDLIRAFELNRKLFGSTAAVKEEFGRRALKVGDAIARFHNVTMEKGRELPVTDEIGPEAEALFLQLQSWIRALGG